MSNSPEKHTSSEISEAAVLDKWIQRIVTYSGIPAMLLFLILDRTYLAIACSLWIAFSIGNTFLKTQRKNYQPIELGVKELDSPPYYSDSRNREITGPNASEVPRKDSDLVPGGLESNEQTPAFLGNEISSEIVINAKLEETIDEDISEIVEEVKMSTGNRDYGKILVRRFLNLNEYDRDQVITSLGIDAPPLNFTEESDSNREIFQRVVDRNLLEPFWAAVEKKHGDNMFTENPFTSEEKI